MSEYACGFMFSEDHELVLLIKKSKPEWQRGKLNGIGGKIEPGETALAAMIREFTEETGVVTGSDDWTHFAKLRHVGNLIHFFSASKQCQPKSLTDERVIWVQLAGIKHNPQVIPNLLWLIPMALDKDGVFAEIDGGSA